MSENIQDKYRQVLNESKVSGDDAAVTAAVADILAKHFDENNNVDVASMLSTSLNSTLPTP